MSDFTINPCGHWSDYTDHVPANMYPVGTITWSNGCTGALFRFKANGKFTVLLNGMTIWLSRDDKRLIRQKLFYA